MGRITVVTDQTIMALGFQGRRFDNLTLYERSVWADRLKGYLLYPKDEQGEQRLRYQACRSAYRTNDLNGRPDEILNTAAELAKRAEYLTEERVFFDSVGAEDTILNAQGLAYYDQRELQTYFDAYVLWCAWSDLLQVRSTPELGAYYGVHITFDFTAKKLARDTAEIAVELGRAGICDVELPKNSIKVAANKQYLERLWLDALPVLPYLIVLGMVGAIPKKDGLDLQNYVSSNPSQFVSLAAYVEHSLRPPPKRRDSKAYPKPQEIWRLPAALMPEISPAKTALELGPLNAADLKLFGIVKGAREKHREQYSKRRG